MSIEEHEKTATHSDVDLERTLPKLVGQTITLNIGNVYFHKGDKFEVLAVSINDNTKGTHGVICKVIRDNKVLNEQIEIGGGVFISFIFNSLKKEDIVLKGEIIANESIGKLAQSTIDLVNGLM